MTTEPALLSAANAILPDVIAIRRRVHRRPEIGVQLPITQALIVEELERLGLSPRRGETVSSVTATIDGGRPGPTILLRGDMDALPLQEATGLDFTSEVAGTMHACGHDCHIAMLLGAARLLVERRAELPGRVLLMFQPGEEGYAGARFMLEEGLLDVPTNGPHGPVTGAFAIHIGTRYPTGTIRLRPGPQMASSDVISITVHGSGGHASTPHLAVDPITVAAEIILGLQTMVTRRVDPFDPAVITIANVIAGTTNNIIPETAFMKGTLRTVSEETRARIKPLIERLARGIAEAHGATAEVALEAGYPVTANDERFARFVAEVGGDLVGADAVEELRAPIMGAEDFSYVLQKVPGAMAFLGAVPPGNDPAGYPQNHSDKVIFDEPALAVGVALYVSVAQRHLEAATV
ncbi:MAG TPA: M20 family metallopeptidase [Candidatus Limnocylindrales bacterium]|nr:M20 family metallopeptidase [Candidatus Limnocylindrales bacterium]